MTDFLTERRVLQLLLDELTSAHAAAMFAPALRARCRAALVGALQTQRARRAGPTGARPGSRRAVPARLRAVVGNWRPNPPSLEPLVLAFRVFVASRMQAMLARRCGNAACRARGSRCALWGSR